MESTLVCESLSTNNIVEEDKDIHEIQKERKSLSKGETILNSTPFAYILKGKLRGLYCDDCLRKKSGLQRCSSCACGYYCNRLCQKNSWEVHKKECRNLKKLKPNLPPDTVRLIARIILRLKDGGNDIEEKIDFNWSRKFKHLQDHSIDIKENSTRQEHFESILVVLKSFMGEENIPNTNELLEIYGKVLINSFTITDKDLNGVGLGIYLSASILDHSCKPNCYASFNGKELVMKSLYDQPKLEWDKLRISYIDVLNTRQFRQKELEEGYFFKCDCQLCLDTSRDKIMFSINCGNTNCSNPVYVNDEGKSDEEGIDPCSKCGFSNFEIGTRQKYREIVNLTRETLDKKSVKGRNDLEAIESLIEKQGNLLHKLNIWRVKTLDSAFETAINKRAWDSALSNGTQNLDGIRFYYGSNHPMYGVTLLKLGKMELYLFKLEEAFNHLRVAEPILQVSHGKENPIYAEDLTPLYKQAKQEIGMMQCNGFKVLNRNK